MNQEVIGQQTGEVNIRHQLIVKIAGIRCMRIESGFEQVLQRLLHVPFLESECQLAVVRREQVRQINRAGREAGARRLHKRECVIV